MNFKIKQAYQKPQDIPIANVIRIQALSDYVEVFTTEGKHVMPGRMHELTELHKDTFVRIHRSHLVNKDRSVRVKGNKIQVSSPGQQHTILSIGREFKQNAKDNIPHFEEMLG